MKINRMFPKNWLLDDPNAPLRVRINRSVFPDGDLYFIFWTEDLTREEGGYTYQVYWEEIPFMGNASWRDDVLEGWIIK